MKKIAAILFFVALPAPAFIGDGGAGWAQIPYLVRLVAENVKRYHQLREVIRQSEERRLYERMLNRGIDNAAGLLPSVPIEDEKILENLGTFKDTVSALEELYGAIRESPDAEMFRLHDETVAESIKLIGRLKNYARVQEKNAEAVFRQAQGASPKGAGRMAAVTNSQILHALSQLIRINGQMLKLQSESFASQNKRGKDSAGHFNEVNREMERSLGRQRSGGSFPRF